MSFILDALRKSENARQRHGGPTLAEVPIARRKESRPWWIAVVAALLAVNVLVMLYVLTRGPEPTPAQVAVPPVSVPAPAAALQPSVAAPPAPAAAPVAAAPVVAAPAQPASIAVPVIPPATAVAAGRSLAEEAAATAVVQPGDPDAPSRAIAAAANVPDREPIVRSLTPGTPEGTSQTAGEENLPTLNELTGERATELPAMHLDIHVYSTNPADRFVFINNRKYNEGATLQEGPVVERIRADGVVLNQRGFRFILPRQ